MGRDRTEPSDAWMSYEIPAVWRCEDCEAGRAQPTTPDIWDEPLVSGTNRAERDELARLRAGAPLSWANRRLMRGLLERARAEGCPLPDEARLRYALQRMEAQDG
jgi:hypothetical protein